MNTKPFLGKRLWIVRAWLIALAIFGVIGAFVFGPAFLIWLVVPAFLVALLPQDRRNELLGRDG